jgi:hypothetical protein
VIDARAVRYAVDHGAQVVLVDLMSLEAPSLALESSVRDAVAGT